MAATKATLAVKYAALAEQFGEDYATRLFGAGALSDLPRYVRGKNAGKLKGYLIWIKAETGGWSRYGAVRPGTVRAWIGPGPFSSESDAVDGMFLGRVQRLAASIDLLGDKNRARAMEDRL